MLNRLETIGLACLLFTQVLSIMFLRLSANGDGGSFMEMAMTLALVAVNCGAVFVFLYVIVRGEAAMKDFHDKGAAPVVSFAPTPSSPSRRAPQHTYLGAVKAGGAHVHDHHVKLTEKNISMRKAKANPLRRGGRGRPD